MTKVSSRPGVAAFGRRLASVRARRGVTLRWLAGETGMSHTHAWQLEQGQSAPSAITLERLADALGFTMDELWRGVGRCEGMGEES